MDREALEIILKKTFEGKQEVLLVGKESKIYIDEKGEPVFLKNVSLPGLLIITQEQDKQITAQIFGEPKKYSYYCFGAELRVSESHGFTFVYKEVVAVDFLREIN